MLKLKLQYFGHLMWSTDSLEKTLMLGGTEGRRRRERQRMRWLDGITDFDGHEFERALGVGDGQGGLVCCGSWGSKELDTTERLNWTDLWCLRRLLRVPWIARSSQSILKDISLEYSLEGLMLKLKLQYSHHLMWRTDSLEKTLMLGNIDGRRRRGQQRMKWLDGITISIDMSEQALGVGGRQGNLVCCSPWGHRVRHDRVTELK